MERKPYNNAAVESAVKALDKQFEDSFQEMRRYMESELAKLNREGQILTRDVDNIRQLREIANTLKLKAREVGFGDILDRQSDELLGLAKEVLSEAKNHGMADQFTKTSGELIKSLMFDAQKQITARETLVAQDLEKILVRSATGNVEWMDLVGRIQDRLDLNQRQAMTNAADAIASFHTQTRREHFEDVEAQGKKAVVWWLYDGPRDERNRDWCAHFVGTRVTMEILNKHATEFGRKHPLPPDVSLGGWGCRHELIPLINAEAWEKYPIGPRKLVLVGSQAA